MPRGRRNKPTPPGRRASAPGAVPVVTVLPRREPPAVRALGEDPHAHIVCRICGRIQGLELTELDRHLLTELADRTPDGWTVERIAYSLAGACRRCREGPAAP